MGMGGEVKALMKKKRKETPILVTSFVVMS